MIRAIGDTNVLVQATLGSPRSASARTVDAYLDRKYQIVFSPQTVEELLHVLSTPGIRARSGWSEDQVLEFVVSLMADVAYFIEQQAISASTTRDQTDVKFLSLAAVSKADYLVTNDRRHLLRLRRFGRTRIVTPTRFLRVLS